MNAPQTILVVLLSLEVGITLALHGKPKGGLNGHYSFGSKLVSVSILIGLLWWGGFWK